MIDLVVLALLLDGPRYGYRLKREAAMALGTASVHNNTIYPLLARFHAAGWVRLERKPGARGQTRQMVVLTAAGRRELLRRLRSFSAREAAQPGAFELRASLFDLLPAPARRQILEAHAAALSVRQARLDAVAKQFPLAGYAASVLEFRRRRLALELQWLQDLRSMENEK